MRHGSQWPIKTTVAAPTPAQSKEKTEEGSVFLGLPAIVKFPLDACSTTSNSVEDPPMTFSLNRINSRYHRI